MIPDDLGAGGYIVKVARKLAENSIFVTDDIFQAFVGLDPYPQPLGVDACERIVKSPLPAVCLVGVTDVRPKPFGPGHISNSLLSSSP